jgi:hypothetical protein
MKNSTRFFIGFSLLVLVACYGCSVSSEVEMKAAQEAMDAAKSIHADELAASNWNEAMQAWYQGEAAVKEGKPSKTYFLRAKSRFEKTATIAKARRDDVAREVSDIQQTINERLAKVKTALTSGKLTPRIQNQLKPLVAEVETGSETVGTLIGQADFVKARTAAKEIQKKVFNVELILAGKKPVS